MTIARFALALAACAIAYVSAYRTGYRVALRAAARALYQSGNMRAAAAILRLLD